MRWPGFRKVRSQVCKRIRRRLNTLALDDLDAYKRYLETHADEWPRLDSMCRITISRFYRDRGVFEALEAEVLPALATAARKRGDYAEVLDHRGRTVRHYALSNHKEYFAEATEAYFYRNDFYPFVRAELLAFDPGLHELLVEFWGPLP